MTNITATTGINPLVQPLNTGEEEQRVANTTRNAAQDNVAARAPEATDETAPRNNSQSSTQPQEELNRRDDPELQSERQELTESRNESSRNESSRSDTSAPVDQPAPRTESSVTVTLSTSEEPSQAPALSRDDLIRTTNEPPAANESNIEAETATSNQSSAASTQNETDTDDTVQASSTETPPASQSDDQEPAPDPRVSSFLEQNAEQRVGINLNATA
jgi:hypothetical protein